jgi:hypothetical protein
MFFSTEQLLACHSWQIFKVNQKVYTPGSDKRFYYLVN